MLPIFLYAFEMKRLEYWQAANITTAYMDGLARYHALARNMQDKQALAKALLLAIGNKAQDKLNALIDNIDDEAILTPEQQEDIYNQMRDYQRIIFGVSEQLQ